jgi:hypothetical protein
MINLLSHTASKFRSSSKSRQKCKLSLLVKRIVIEGIVIEGYVSVEISRGLKAAATTPMPVKDGLVLAAGVQELSLISTIERDEYNERREKIFKLSVKLVSADQRGKKIEGDSKVLGAIEIDVSAEMARGSECACNRDAPDGQPPHASATPFCLRRCLISSLLAQVSDFIGNGDPLNVQQPRTWSVPCRKGDKHITIETVCSARPVPKHKILEQSDDSNFSDMSSCGASDDEDNMPRLLYGLVDNACNACNNTR